MRKEIFNKTFWAGKPKEHYQLIIYSDFEIVFGYVIPPLDDWGSEVSSTSRQITSQGAMGVYRKVAAILKDWLYTHKPNYIHFKSHEDQLLRIYIKLIQKSLIKYDSYQEFGGAVYIYFDWQSALGVYELNYRKESA